MRSQSSDHHQKQIPKQLRKSNYYEILEVDNKASDAQIKKSFKRMALKYHPDKNQASYSKEVFHKISQAYDTLSDPMKRNVYDEKQGRAERQGRAATGYEHDFFAYNSQSFSGSRFGASYKSQFEKEYERQQQRESKKQSYQRWAQFKMDQKAREQRQRHRNDHNQKFKKQSENSTKASNQKFRSYKTFASQGGTSQEDSRDESSRREQPFTFTFEKKQFKPAYERKNPQFEEYKRQQQRKASLQKQKAKAQDNIRKFMIFILLVVVWVSFSYFGPAMKGLPVYSMHQSSTYKLQRFTKQLKSPFFVTQDYDSRAKSDDKFREYLDRKIDLVYLKTLSRVCNTMLQKQQELEKKLDITKSKKSKQQVYDELQSLDMTACDKLHDARQLNPVYFKQLFSEPTTKQQTL